MRLKHSIPWFLYYQMVHKFKEQITNEGWWLRETKVFEQLIIGDSKHLLRKNYKMILQYDTNTEKVKPV